MAGLGKKILSAFVEVSEKKSHAPSERNAGGSPADPDDAAKLRFVGTQPVTPTDLSGGGPSRGDEERRDVDNRSDGGERKSGRGDERFTAYFDKLFSEANIPGPDYYEFSKMIAAMEVISDEQSRFYAAYAGLQVQGLDKAKLLSTATEYLQVLETDAARFRNTAAATLEEKVNKKKAEAEEKSQRIQSLSREISDLQQQIITLQMTIKENEEKIQASTGGYTAECENRKTRILADIEKINRYLH